MGVSHARERYLRRRTPLARLEKFQYIVPQLQYWQVTTNISQAEDIENNAEYLAIVGIGTPAQNVKLDFDTGSAGKADNMLVLIWCHANVRMQIYGSGAPSFLQL